MPHTIIDLPQVGESVTEGVISKWLVQPGEKVRKFAPLVEVMTDKVNMEVPSPYTGTLTKTLVAEGDTVPMGQPIAEMEIDGEGEGAAPVAKSTSLTPTFEFVDSVRSVGPTGSGEGGRGRPDALQDAALASQLGAPTRLSPIVKRLVAQHDVDPTKLNGTGQGGRVTKEDVMRLVEATRGRNAPARSLSDLDPDRESLIQLTPLRKTIAAHMVRSAQEIPAAWTMIEVDVTGMVNYRGAHRKAFEQDQNIPLTYLPFAAHVIARALIANPMINSRWNENHIVLNKHVNLGIAVSTDAGLIVPVIHGAEALTVTELALRAQGLGESARLGTLNIADVQGGTFTLDNTGALGSVISVPIVNYPQAAIITTEAIKKRPVVLDRDAIVVRSIMNVCMTFDHRVCDGADVGRFLTDVRVGLEAISETSVLL